MIMHIRRHTAPYSPLHHFGKKYSCLGAGFESSKFRFGFIGAVSPRTPAFLMASSLQIDDSPLKESSLD